MNNLIIRSLTGIVFVLVIVGSVIGGPWIFATLFLLISMFTQLEFYRLISKGEHKTQMYIGMGSGIFLYGTLAASAPGLGLAGHHIILLNLIPLALIFISALYAESANPFADIGITLTGILYIAMPFGLLNYFYTTALFLHEANYGILLGFFLIIWLNDTFAYLVGSVIGKHHL